MRVAITGTPGTGKSAVGRALKRRGFYVLELNKAIVRHKLYAGIDRKRKTFIADMPAIRTFLKKTFSEGLIVSHLSHLLPAIMVDVVVILRCNPEKLRLRLIRKRWKREKVAENVEAELIGLIAAESRQRHKKVYEIDTTAMTATQAADAIEKVLKGAGERYRTAIDWLR